MTSKNQVAPQSRAATIAQFFGDEANQRKLRNALGKAIPAKSYLQAAMNAIRKDARLQACSPDSLFQSLLGAAELKLVVGSALGHAYLVAYNKQCTLIIGYRGLIDLATRGGKVKHVEARTVHGNDDFDFAYGSDQFLRHKLDLGEAKTKGNLRAVYALATLEDGSRVFDVLLPHEIEDARKRSQSGKGGGGPWGSDYLEMARKTAVRRLSKYLPLTAEAQAAIRIDEERDLGLMPRDVDVEPSAADALNAELEPETSREADAEEPVDDYSDLTGEEADRQAEIDAWARSGKGGAA